MPAYLGCGGSRFLLPFVGMKSCVCDVRAHAYGGVFLIFNMVAFVTEFG